MPDGGGARWQIDILAADKSTAAFASFDRRIQSTRQSLRQMAQESMAAAQRQADGFARMAAAQPAAQAAGYARLAAATARTESAMNVARLAEQSGAALAAMYGVGVAGAEKMRAANDRALQSVAKLQGGGPAGAAAGVGPRPQEIDRADAGILALTRNLKQLAVAYGVVRAASYAWSVGMRSGELIDQAAQLGVTTEALQAYRLAAATAGVDSGEFDKALQKLTAGMGAAKGGSDEAIEKFEKLGVKLLDADGKLRSVSDVLPEAARGLLKVSSETERNALAQEVFGKSGSRLVTMLAALAAGTDAVTDAARAQGAVIERDTLEAWNKLDSQLKVTGAAADAALASLGAPIATWALEQVNRILTDINANLARLKLEQQTIRGRTAAMDVKELQDQLAAQENLLKINPNNFSAKASADGLRKRLAAAQAVASAEQAADAASMLAGDTPAYTPPRPPGTSNPTGTRAGTAGEKLDVRLRELQTERKALEQALATFEIRGNETVAEAERRIDAQVKLDQKIFDVLKDVPPESPLAQQLVQEATAISLLTQRLDEKKRLLAEAEGVTRQYGDGQRDLARTTEQLDRMLRAGAISQGTFNAAMKAAREAASDAERAYRGAQGGAEGFLAGIEQGLADIERANSAFNMGRRLVDELSDAIGDLATGAEVDFNRILQSFLSMIVQMEMRALASNVWNMITGKGPTNQGIGGAAGDWLSSLFGGGDFFSAGPIAVDGIPTIALAGGGEYRPGVPRIVGERGWELDVPNHGGTIYNQDQLRSLLGMDGGGGVTVVVNNTNQFGSVVSRAEMDEAIRRNSEAQSVAITARVLDAKTRGGAYRTTWRR